MSNNEEQCVSDYSKAMKKHIRTQQLRKVKRKSGSNRSDKKPRRKNWDQESLEEWDELEYETLEPIMPRGENERRRSLESKMLNQSDRQAHLSQESTESPPANHDDEQPPGIVIEVSSGMARVSLNGDILLCTIRQSLCKIETGYSNVVAVGDEVIISYYGKKEGVVETILPRRSILARMYRPDKGKTSDIQQIVAANIDQVMIVTSWREPNLWPELIDRYLITAQINDLTPVLCVNKIDLVEDKNEFQEIILPYQELGIKVIKTSAKTGQGIKILHSLFAGQTTVLAGLSGVGKSSLLASVQPNLQLKTKPVGESRKNRNMGRHTTSQSTLIQLENGGTVIDTPGIREFGVNQLCKTDLAAYYIEFTQAAFNCRYKDCSHISEDDCAVKTAVMNGLIFKTRYENYCNIHTTLPDYV